jgi:hypothetical protein
MKFKYEVYKDGVLKEEIFEIQLMDKIDFTQATAKYQKNEDIREYANTIFKEMIVEPVEARNVSFFDDDVEALGVVIEQCVGFIADKISVKRNYSKPIMIEQK